MWRCGGCKNGLLNKKANIWEWVSFSSLMKWKTLPCPSVVIRPGTLSISHRHCWKLTYRSPQTAHGQSPWHPGWWCQSLWWGAACPPEGNSKALGNGCLLTLIFTNEYIQTKIEKGGIQLSKKKGKKERDVVHVSDINPVLRRILLKKYSIEANFQIRDERINDCQRTKCVNTSYNKQQQREKDQKMPIVLCQIKTNSVD